MIPWQKRDDVEVLALDRALASKRGPSFFEEYTFEKWRRAWRSQLEAVADVKQREPLLT